MKGFYEEEWSAKLRIVFGMDEELSFWNDPPRAEISERQGRKRTMKEKKLRRLGRADLVEILYRQRELIDQLDEQNRRLQERAEKAEAQAREYAVQRQKEQERAAADEALRRDMRRTIEIVEKMTDSMGRCVTR